VPRSSAVGALLRSSAAGAWEAANHWPQCLALKDAMKTRPKKRYVLIGALILVVVGLAGIASEYMASRPRFRFLQGQEPAIAMGFSGGSPAYNGGVSEIYSFPADFNTVYPDIKAELTSLGFGESRRYRHNNPEHYFQNSDRDRCFVRVLRDRKLSPQSTPAQLLYEPKKGWISVHVNHYQSRLDWWYRLVGRFRNRTIPGKAQTPRRRPNQKRLRIGYHL
jgi:hypothetical protein